MRAFGIVLIMLGALMLIYQGFTYVSRETVVDVGPVTVTAAREKTIWIPSVMSAAAVISGFAILAFARRPID